MPYLTERKLSNTLDVPVNLPATNITMGNWLVIASLQVVAPTLLTYRMLHLNFISSAVNLSNLTPANLIVANYGFCYVGLFYGYTSGDPSTLSALDVVQTSTLGIQPRTTSPLVINTAGTYSWIAVNNVQYSSSNSLLPSGESADFVMSCVGQCRLELDLTD
jgi:hypothetical protein